MRKRTTQKLAKTRSNESRLSGGIELELPATSANLGPAFDAAALALNLFLKVRADPARQFSIQAKGRDAGICGTLENHLVLTTYREVLLAEKKPVQPLSLQIENEIPIGKGCGSSAAARLAGIALAVHFGKLSWNDDRIIGEASRRERHADNSAACWLGGLTIARMADSYQAQTARFEPKGKWPLLLAIPEQSLATEKARGVLPAHYSRADAVTNIQNSMLLLAAFVQGAGNLLSATLEDRMHQPYRAALCPLLPALQKLGPSAGIVGVTLSGAGPSVLVFLSPGARGVEKRIDAHLRSTGLAAELIATTITDRGGSTALGNAPLKKPNLEL